MLRHFIARRYSGAATKTFRPGPTPVQLDTAENVKET